MGYGIVTAHTASRAHTHIHTLHGVRVGICLLFTEDEARGKTKKTFPDEGGRVFACTPSCVLVRCRVLCDATLLAGGRFHTRSHMNKGIRTNTHTYAPPRTVFGEEKRTLTSSHFPCQQRAMCFFAAASCCPGWNTKEKRSRGLFCAVSLTDRIRIPSKERWWWCPVVWFGLGKANSFPLFFWHTLYARRTLPSQCHPPRGRLGLAA